MVLKTSRVSFLYRVRTMTIDTSRFTEGGAQVMNWANIEAQKFERECLDTEHILLGLSNSRHGSVASTTNGWHPRSSPLVEAMYGRGRNKKVVLGGWIPFSQDVECALKNARDEADKYHHEHINTGHLLLSISRPGPNECTALKLIRQGAEMKPEDFRPRVERILRACRDLEEDSWRGVAWMDDSREYNANYKELVQLLMEEREARIREEYHASQDKHRSQHEIRELATKGLQVVRRTLHDEGLNQAAEFVRALEGAWVDEVADGKLRKPSRTAILSAARKVEAVNDD
jgi:hypothetical protein